MKTLISFYACAFCFAIRFPRKEKKSTYFLHTSRFLKPHQARVMQDRSKQDKFPGEWRKLKRRWLCLNPLGFFWEPESHALGSVTRGGGAVKERGDYSEV